MVNKELKKALLSKLHVSRQAIDQRIEKIQIPMTTEDAWCVIAQQEGIPLKKYLDKEEVERIRQVYTQYMGQHQGKNTPESLPIASRSKRNSENRTVFISAEFKESDPLLPAKILSEAKEMAAVFPLLYVLENSIREFIIRIAKAKIGLDWWDRIASKTLKTTVGGRMVDEKRNSWHQRRGATPVHYLDLNELSGLLHHIEPHTIPDILPTLRWIQELIDEVYKSRCVLCHMNPLEKTSIDSVRLRFTQWQRQMKEKVSLIPEA
jgi:hypothetical protein